MNRSTRFDALLLAGTIAVFFLVTFSGGFTRVFAGSSQALLSLDALETSTTTSTRASDLVQSPTPTSESWRSGPPEPTMPPAVFHDDASAIRHSRDDISRREIINKRTARTKTLTNRDGSYTQLVYSNDVHVEESPGVWKEVVNDLRPSARQGFAYENGANKFSVRFAALSSEETAELSHGQTSVVFGLAEAATVPAQVAENTITYAGVRDGIDLRLTVETDRVKEEIIIHSLGSPPNPSESRFSPFVFHLKTSGLGARPLQDGAVGLYAGDDLTMVIPAAFMYDVTAARGNPSGISYDVTTSIQSERDGIRLTLYPSLEWLTSPQRVFPIVIDPTIVIQPDEGTGKDLYISSGAPNTRKTCCSLLTGVATTTSAATTTFRSLLQFDLSHIPASSTVTDAKLYLNAKEVNGSGYRMPIDIHRVTQVWSASTSTGATWSARQGTTTWSTPGGSFQATSTGSFMVDTTATTSKWYSSDVTRTVQEWVNGKYDNNGFLLKLASEALTAPQIVSIDTARDLTVNGIAQGDKAGAAVSVGDINDDGVDDLVIGAIEADPSGASNAGKTFVIFGTSTAGTYQLSSATTSDITLNGITAGDKPGFALAVGDLNGDGNADLAIGAPYGDPNGTDSGEVYVVFGPLTAGTYNLSSATTSDVLINGADAGDLAGSSIAIGDVNNDGYDDIIIGAMQAESAGAGNSGETYVIFGPLSAGTLELSTDADLTFRGIDSDDLSGSGAGSGDINGGGIDDIIIGAQQGDPESRSNAGEIYVVYGPVTQVGAYWLSSATTTDLTIKGATAGDLSGSALGSGDVNADGIQDLLIGAPGAGSNSGKAYVVFGPVGFGS
ncbi:MAG: DNRLRE domain-containing protein [SAR202 cluster bacterium]|nr:DNRLRE domain-containing protein [SAR202 cluster bacterium]